MAQMLENKNESVWIKILIFILGIIVAVLACLVGAIVLAFMSSPITGLLFCFGLWEAWRINKRPPFLVKGPFRLGNPASLGDENSPPNPSPINA